MRSSALFLCATALTLCACESVVGIHDVIVVTDDAAATQPAPSPDPSPSSSADEASTDAGVVCNDLPDVAPCTAAQSASGVAEGQPCNSGCFCRTGLACSYALGGNIGQCTKRGACGDPCTDDTDCLSLACRAERCR